MTINEAGPILAREHGLRVLAPDAPGFGKSPALEPSDYHPHALADLVPRLLDALDIERAPFVGFSWGGDVGCHVAARHPERLTALVLLDAGYDDPPFDPSQPFAEYLAENEAAWEENVEPSWDAVFAGARERFRRWSPAIESSVRAGRVERDSRIRAATLWSSQPSSTVSRRPSPQRRGRALRGAACPSCSSPPTTRTSTTLRGSPLTFRRPRSAGPAGSGTTSSSTAARRLSHSSPTGSRRTASAQTAAGTSACFVAQSSASSATPSQPSWANV